MGMAGRFAFLTATWSNLAIITYAVDPEVLVPHVPPGCEADTLDGRAFVSLVAFDFLDTRVLGVRWPGFVNFPEINLRAYVRRDGKQRGVTFIRELVPSRFIATVARKIYNEPYLAVPMRSEVAQDERSIATTHVATLDGREHSIRVRADADSFTPDPSSVEHFFKEHSWGYGSTRDGRLISYEVNHPTWAVYRNPRVERLEWDFGAVYGDRWKFLIDARPHSVVFAVGSSVSVYPRGTAAIEKAKEAAEMLQNQVAG
jgi:uncharacterized protein